MPVDRGNPGRFHRSTEWKKVMDDFFHGQLDSLGGCRRQPAELFGVGALNDRHSPYSVANIIRG